MTTLDADLFVREVLDARSSIAEELVDGYSSLTSPNSVEYGVGLGRIADLIQPRYAVEILSSVAESCAMRLPCTKVICDDMIRVTLPERVQYSYAPNGTLGHLPNSAVLAEAFRNFWKNSEDSAVLAFDLLPEEYFLEILERSRNPLLVEGSGDFLLWTVVLPEDRFSFRRWFVVEKVESGRKTVRYMTRPCRERYVKIAEAKALAESVGWKEVSSQRRIVSGRVRCGSTLMVFEKFL